MNGDTFDNDRTFQALTHSTRSDYQNGLSLLHEHREVPSDARSRGAFAQWLWDHHLRDLAAYVEMGGYAAELAMRAALATAISQASVPLAMMAKGIGEMVIESHAALTRIICQRLAELENRHEERERGEGFDSVPTPQFHLPPRR